MHGGQSIPAFDFYLAPSVKMSFQEELKRICEVLNISIPDEVVVEEYEIKELPSDITQRAIQSAINNTVKRVHQAMEAFIHNMNTIHSRGKLYCHLS